MRPRIFSRIVLGRRMWMVSFLGHVEEAYDDWQEAFNNALTIQERLMRGWWNF